MNEWSKLETFFAYYSLGAMIAIMTLFIVYEQFSYTLLGAFVLAWIMFIYNISKYAGLTGVEAVWLK